MNYSAKEKGRTNTYYYPLGTADSDVEPDCLGGLKALKSLLLQTTNHLSARLFLESYNYNEVRLF